MRSILLVDTDTFCAHWFPLDGIKRLAGDRQLAVPAHEAGGMPLSGQGRHVVLHNGPVASSALGREHVEVIVPTIRTALPLVESLLAELFAALGAEKVFRVPRLLQRRHAFVQYGPVAVRASGREQVVIVWFAVRPSVAFEEIPRAQLLRAVRARKVLRVPRLAQRRYHLADDRLVARGATAFLRRVHALSVHLGGQTPEHAVQRRRRVYRLAGGVVTRLHGTGHSVYALCVIVADGIV